MTPQEMLIGLDQILQKVNSNAVSSFEVEEKLWFLNEECVRYIKQRISPLSNNKRLGFQETEKRYDDLEALITSKSLSVYVRDNLSVFTFLPADYFALINSRSLTKNLCGASYSPTVTNSNIYTVCYTLPEVSDLFESLVVKKGADILFTVADYYPDGIASQSSSFELIDILIEIFNNTQGLEAKYEYLNGIYCKGGIVVSSTTTFTLSNNYVVGVTPTVNTFDTKTNTFSKISVIQGVEEHDNRLVKTEKIYSMLNTNFSTTLFHSPISSLQQGTINVYHKKKFMLSSINLDYIRKPKKISLILNQGCELSENVHEEIVENTAKRLAAYTSSQGYNNIINENLLNE